MSRAKIVTDGEGRYVGIRIRCPACMGHMLPTDWIPEGMERSPAYASQAHWGFDGNLERPTLTPSILARYGHFATGQDALTCLYCADDDKDGATGRERGCARCHSYVRDGRIEFLADCSHALAGQGVDLPEIDA